MSNNAMFIRCLLLSLLLCSGTVWANDKITVKFINPDKQGNSFWDSVTLFMEGVAEDLDIDLQVHYANANRFKATAAALDAIKHPQPPDFLIYIYQHGQGHKILQAAETAGVKSLIFNTNIPKSERAQVGYPGQIFKHWLAHIIPDDKKAGFDLAEFLILSSKQQNESYSPIEIVAFAGTRDSSASEERVVGLHLALDKYPQVTFHQLFHALWSKEKARDRMPQILQRYPNTRIIWAASDSMALGAAEGLRQNNKLPGKDFILGGIDWTREGIDAIKSGELTASMGGHLMDGGRGLIMIHDYAHGVETSSSTNTYVMKQTLVNNKNLDLRLPLHTKAQLKKLNFHSCSKVYTNRPKDFPACISSREAD